MHDYFDPLMPNKSVLEIYKYHEKLAMLYKRIKLVNEIVARMVQKGMVLFPSLERGDAKATYDLLTVDNQNGLLLFDDDTYRARGVGRLKAEIKEALKKGSKAGCLISIDDNTEGRTDVRKKMICFFRCIVFRCKILNIYDELRNEGINVEGLWYKDCTPTYYEIYEDRERFKHCTANKEKLNIAKRLFAEYFFIRDFMDLEKLYPEMIVVAHDLGEDMSLYEDIYRCTDDYMRNAKITIDGKPHIVLNWVDAIRYNELPNMPWLEKKMHEGVFFERMYTNTPYTSATMKSIFTGENLIEGKLYKSRGLLYSRKEYEHFPFFRVLKKYGYEFKYIGTVLETEGIDPGNVKIYKHLYNDTRWLPSTLSQFEGIRFLSETEKPTFVIIHDLIETHEPFANPWYKCVVDGDTVRRVPYSMLGDQVIESQSFQDELIKYFSRFYEDVRYNIFMSDHGKVMGSIEDLMERMYHVILAVNGKELAKQTVKTLYSMQEFHKILEQILSGRMQFEEDDEDKLVVIENDDVYNSEVLERVTEAGDSVYRYVQLRGVISNKDAFFRFATGNEGYYIYGNKKNYIDDKRFTERIVELRKKNGFTFIDIMKDPKYKAAAEMYRKMGLTRSERNIYIQ